MPSSLFVVNPGVTNPPSARLTALLEFLKNHPSEPLSWYTVPKALGELYHPKMTLADAMHHLVHAHKELVADARFEIGRSDSESLDLLLAPVKGSHSVELLGATHLNTTYTVEQFYDSMARHILSAILLSRVDWLRAPAAD